MSSMCAERVIKIVPSGTLPAPGSRCISCLDVLMVQMLGPMAVCWCINIRCVRTGLLSTAWVDPEVKPEASE